ncbi:P-type conjugative transfer protein TrbJ [Allosphingosinicella indica]|uniref:P-type conjugative transfer protein TrbJ n=1 Tax=Allosphingosinicella indica TaxID=941907 RepID=A0A1X7G026_9SPHN|nr:P-type conjugative transfer protein TrbJ [Allosphingosinicella indica]SMF61203.1 P-type conjugative transfer protein TrbJ [Allosphingosinicella indica]
MIRRTLRPRATGTGRRPRRPHRTRAIVAIPALAAALAAALPAPAAAQLTVFDPSTYGQSVLTAARTLEQINNQVRSLQNESTGLLNQARNLSRIDFPELAKLRANIAETGALLREARGLGFDPATLEREMTTLVPDIGAVAGTSGAAARGGAARLEAAIAAHRQALRLQARIAKEVARDADALGAIVGRSQGAEGQLQASQATNQLLALAAKQQLQVQTLLAAQDRARSLDAARQAQGEAEARAATRRFLGSGRAYRPD